MTSAAGDPGFNGRIDGTQIVQVGSRLVAGVRSKSFSRQARRGSSVAREMATAIAQWLTLSSGEQAEWGVFAEEVPLYDLYGSPRFVTGQTYFIRYNTNARTFNGQSGWQITPPSAPTWEDRPKFEEFARIDGNGVLLLQAETEFPAGTKILAFGQPVQSGRFRLDRQNMRWLGTVEFVSGLAVAEETAAFSQLFVDAFGQASLGSALGNWMLLWQIDGGFMRVLKDPCLPPPPPPGGTFTYTVTITNNGADGIFDSSVEVLMDGFDLIIIGNVNGLAVGDSMQFTAQVTGVCGDHTFQFQGFADWDMGGHTDWNRTGACPSESESLG